MKEGLQAMTKSDFIQFVKHQTGVELINDKTDFLNAHRKTLYTQIKRDDYLPVKSFLVARGFRVESHIKDRYFIHLA